MGTTTKIYYNKTKAQEVELEEKKNNISQLESDNYTLTFRKGELEDYIKEGNTEHKRKIDSIATANNIKIKDLQNVISVLSNAKADTVPVYIEVPILLPDSTYSASFVVDTVCVGVKGRIISKDPFPKLIFDRIGFENETHHFKYKEPKKWWQIFKKRKTILKSVSKCGGVTYKELTEEKKK